MKLDKITCCLDNADLIRNGTFENLKLITTKKYGNFLAFIEDKNYLEYLDESIGCIIATKEISNYIPKNIGLIISKNPKIDYFKIHNYIAATLSDKFDTIIGSNCEISDRSIISTHNVKIGNNVQIEENVIIRENVRIDDNSIIRAGSIIGGEGFEFKKIDKTMIMPVKHIGGVYIGKNVEIQYNTCIDKAVFLNDNTTIDDYTKIDNNCYIAHGSKIGKRCLIAGKVSIGGSTIIKDDCWIGLGSTISNGLVIGNDTTIHIGSVVTKSIDAQGNVSGNFAIEHSKYIDFIKQIR